MIPSVQNGKRIIYLHIFQQQQTCFTFVKFKHIFILSFSYSKLKNLLMMQGKMTTLHGFSKNQDISTNVVMPYQNDSRLYFLISENSMMDSLTTESTKKLFNQKWKPHLWLFINLHHSIFIYRYHFFVPRYFNIMLSLPHDF